MNKRLIVLFICLIVISLFIILNSVVFVVRDIEIIYDGNTVQAENVIDGSNIKYGNNMFTLSEKKAIENIEKAYPSVKVEKLERHFPNKISIQLSDRIPVFALRAEGGYFYLDSALKIFSKTQTLSGEFVLLDFPYTGTLKEGDDLYGVNAENASNAAKILSGINKLGITEKAISSVFKSLSFQVKNYALLTLRSGLTLAILTSDLIAEQVQAAYSVTVSEQYRGSLTEGFLVWEERGWTWKASL